MRGPQLEDELMLLAEVDLLQVLALVQIPEVQLAAVFGAEQDFRHEPVLERVGRAPFAGDHRVVAEMPPGVIGELLRPAVDLPAAERLEGLVVHEKNAAGRLALGVAERRDVDALRAAMDRVRARVAGLFGDLLRLDHLDDLRVPRIGLGVEDVDARRAQPRHDQIAPLDMRMRRVRAEAGRAGVPAEMMQLVAGVRHRDACRRSANRSLLCRIDVDHGDGVGLLAASDRRPRHRRASRAPPFPPCAATDRNLDRDVEWPFRPPLRGRLLPLHHPGSVRALKGCFKLLSLFAARGAAKRRRHDHGDPRKDFVGCAAQ